MILRGRELGLGGGGRGGRSEWGRGGTGGGGAGTEPWTVAARSTETETSSCSSVQLHQPMNTGPQSQTSDWPRGPSRALRAEPVTYTHASLPPLTHTHSLTHTRITLTNDGTCSSGIWQRPAGHNGGPPHPSTHHCCLVFPQSLSRHLSTRIDHLPLDCKHQSNPCSRQCK